MKILLRAEKDHGDHYEICELDIDSVISHIFGQDYKNSKASLVLVNDNKRELRVMPVNDPDFPGLFIDGTEPCGENDDYRYSYIASVEMPNQNEPAYTARLFAGNPDTETILPIAVVAYKPRADGDNSRRAIHVDTEYAAAFEARVHTIDAPWPATVKEYDQKQNSNGHKPETASTAFPGIPRTKAVIFSTSVKTKAVRSPKRTARAE